MASLKLLSDEKLRQKLKQHGITSPLTPSTRNILIKKLNHAIVSHRKYNSRVKRSINDHDRTNNKNHCGGGLNTFSSDEEDEDDSWLSPVNPRPITRRNKAATVTRHHQHDYQAGRQRRVGGGGGGNVSVVVRGGGDYDTGSDSEPSCEEYSACWNSKIREECSPLLQINNDDAQKHSNHESSESDARTDTNPPSLPVPNGRHIEQDKNYHDTLENTWQYKVPVLLLVLLVVFFGVVAVLYVNMHVPLMPTFAALVKRVLAMTITVVPFFSSHNTKPPSLPPHSDNKFPVCSSTVKKDCLTVQSMMDLQAVLGQLEVVLLPALHDQAGLYQCGDASTLHMSVSALQDLLSPQEKHSHSHSTLSLSLDKRIGMDVIESLGRLVEWNPHWGVKAVRDDEDGSLFGLALSSQPTFVLCHITAAIYYIFYLIMAAITVAVTAKLAFTFVKYYRFKAEEEKHQVYELVEQILEVLGGLGGGSGKDFVAVNHVRDSLISPRDRRTKQALWNRAVQFINSNESRVRREVQAVSGEECEVWKWASGLPHTHISSSGVGGVSVGDCMGQPPPKVWQGPAFNTLSPHNVPNVSPTSCLKIRNMFDCDVEFGDSWPARIQDSILEKCEGISIVHVAVDRGSREGCVYLKCASLNDSGRAFRALHGWWYDGNLVTVKFLRDQRYHQRFPSAREATLRLRPSNNKRLSLQPHTGYPGV